MEESKKKDVLRPLFHTAYLVVLVVTLFITGLITDIFVTLRENMERDRDLIVNGLAEYRTDPYTGDTYLFYLHNNNIVGGSLKGTKTNTGSQK